MADIEIRNLSVEFTALAEDDQFVAQELAGGAGSTGRASLATLRAAVAGGPINSLTFDTAAAVSVVEGQAAWNDTDKTIDLGLADGTILQIGQEIHLRALNTTGSTLIDGEAVFITGAQGNRTVVARAQANSVNARTTIGLVTQPAISNNQEGYVTLIGLVRGVDTSAWAEGAELWLSPTVAGGITDVKPAAPNRAVRIGIVVRAHATLGSIFVRVIAEETYLELTDTPSSYTGQAGKAPVVNPGETALVFSDGAPEMTITQTANFTLDAPTRSPRHVVYPVDMSGGPFTGTLAATGWLPGDQFTVIDINGGSDITSMIIDFGTHNYFGTASHTNPNVGDSTHTVTYLYVDASTGFVVMMSHVDSQG